MKLRARSLVEIEGERIFEYGDVGGLGLALAEIRESRLHLHRRTTEIYVVLEGRGKVRVGKMAIPVEKGDVVKIPPNTPHKVVGRVRLFVISLPPWRRDDHIILE